jgi:branched-chain amino acid transport system ATP-binding protein
LLPHLRQEFDVKLSVKSIGVRFGGLWANKAIDFDVQGPSIMAVIGPNGAGKSTLFNVITGFVTPTEGSVELDGELLSGLTPEAVAHRGVARTFQIPEICHEMSVEDNVLVGAHRHISGNLVTQALGWWPAARSDHAAHEAVGQILKDTGLWQVRDKPAGILPLGKVRLLEIARALASRPKLMLLDEAASGLNSQEANELAALIRRLPDREVTVILIEHNVGFVMELAERIAVLDHGQLIGLGSPRETRENEAVVSAYLGKRKK